MTTFDIINEHYFAGTVIKADIVKFHSNSKLILSPNQDNPDAQRTLTIITGKIEIVDQAEITYDLDHRDGIDPKTPAPPRTSKAPGGSGGYSGGKVAKYPDRGKDGRPGDPGEAGEDGIPGMNAPSIEIWVNEVTSGDLRIDFRGQDGGRGGDGGDGGPGGMGGEGYRSEISSSWYNGNECIREPGVGGDGGPGGDAGPPGKGGDGGNGGVVKVFTLKEYLPTVQGWTILVRGGKGGAHGNPGQKGTGGGRGLQGYPLPPCHEMHELQGLDGIDGRAIDEIDSKWEEHYNGKDGIAGDKENFYVVTSVPG